MTTERTRGDQGTNTDRVVTYGVTNRYGDLERVLMHRPGPELDVVTPATLTEFNFDRPVDAARFRADYDAMLASFRAHGVETLLLTDVLAEDDDALGYMAQRPNMTYTRDLATVFASGAVLMGPHLKGRWGDQEMLGRAFRRLGVPIIGAIEPPGYLEGGGVTILGDDVVVASLCDRANPIGTRMLRELVLGRDARYFLEVPLPHGHIHIDGLFMVMDAELCLVHEPTLSVLPCRLFEAGRAEPRHVMFLEFLELRGIHRIPITEEERRGGHLNMVVTRRSRRAIGFDQAQRLRGELATRGWTVDTFPSEELFIGNGGAHCMTCPVLIA